jgi:1-deoxy-D-xylulose-5-phosphate reductoisomerase
MKITILGSTGSIGFNTLDVVRQHGDRFQVYALVAGRNLEALCSQITEFKPQVVVVADTSTLDRLHRSLPNLPIATKDWPTLAAGREARIAAATAAEVGFVMSAIVGVAGLEATYAAIQHKKRVGLANKEVSLICQRFTKAFFLNKCTATS